MAGMKFRQTLALAESRRLPGVLEDLLSQAAKIRKALLRAPTRSWEGVINSTAAEYTRHFNLEHRLATYYRNMALRYARSAFSTPGCPR
jgi:hypothetical protein